MSYDFLFNVCMFESRVLKILSNELLVASFNVSAVKQVVGVFCIARELPGFGIRDYEFQKPD